MTLDRRHSSGSKISITLLIISSIERGVFSKQDIISAPVSEIISSPRVKSFPGRL